MGIQLIGLSHAKQKLQRSLSAKIASLLAMSGTKGNIIEEEFGFDHPMGGLTIPCTEDYFTSLASVLSGS
ncbi:hypothetical protein DY000_02009934 [Brassica cretica]|uniref:Auxin-responsive protein n=2 Tax=Brassica TaxID=3705 RepID=A0A0D3BLA9_BRAOL|nr:hypothetical protein DY000_02009934 [Brassica cretica]